MKRYTLSDSPAFQGIFSRYMMTFIQHLRLPTRRHPPRSGCRGTHRPLVRGAEILCRHSPGRSTDKRNARAERRKALAGPVLCRKRTEDLSAPPSHRHSVSPFRMEDPLRDPLRKNDDLRRHCAKTCPRARPSPPIRPRRRKRRRKKSHLPHHPLPPRHRQERPPHRLRRRPSPKSLSPLDGEKTWR